MRSVKKFYTAIFVNDNRVLPADNGRGVKKLYTFFVARGAASITSLDLEPL